MRLLEGSMLIVLLSIEVILVICGLRNVSDLVLVVKCLRIFLMFWVYWLLDVLLSDVF